MSETDRTCEERDPIGQKPWYSLAFEKRAKKKVRSFEAPAPLAPIADTHAHLTCFWSKDPAECLGRAALAGVRQLTTLWDPLGDKRDLATFQRQLAEWLARARELLAEVPEGAALAVPGGVPAAPTVPAAPVTSAAAPSALPAAPAVPAAPAALPAAPATSAVSAVFTVPTPVDPAAPADPASQCTGWSGFRAITGDESEVIARNRLQPAEAGGDTAQFGPATLPDHVCYLAGVHPYGAPAYTDAIHAQVLAALDDPLCAGIGEIGLDYHVDYDDHVTPAPHDVQIACMARQLEVAVARNLPVELHLRNADGDEARVAHADAHRVLEEVGVPAAGCVLHCFGEDRATMERFVDLGCYIAYGGAATFGRNEAVREAFAATPADRILFETDCPYMAPMPIRGLECEPAMIAFTADALSRDRASRTGEDPTAIQQAAWENAVRLFG